MFCRDAELLSKRERRRSAWGCSPGCFGVLYDERRREERMDDCWDGELGDGSSQTLLPRWRDRDDWSPRQCPLWDEDLLVATVKRQRRGDGKGGKRGRWGHAGPRGAAWGWWVVAAVAEVQGHPGSRHNSVISATPRNRCSHYTLPSRPAFCRADKPSPTTLSGQPTPRIQQNAAAVPPLPEPQPWDACAPGRTHRNHPRDEPGCSTPIKND